MSMPSTARSSWVRKAGSRRKEPTMKAAEHLSAETNRPAPSSGPAPAYGLGNPIAGDFVPTVTWPWVQGAVAYDVDVVQPKRNAKVFLCPQAGRLHTCFDHRHRR